MRADTPRILVRFPLRALTLLVGRVLFEWNVPPAPVDALIDAPGGFVAAPPELGANNHAPNAPHAIDPVMIATTAPLRTCIVISPSVSRRTGHEKWR